MEARDKELRIGWRMAAALAVLHVLIALLYAANTPFLTSGKLLVLQPGAKSIDIGAPDELRHVILAGRLVSEPYPKLVNDDKLDLNYQAHQPPLYYYLLSGWMQLVGAKGTVKFALDVQAKPVGETLETLNKGVWAAYGGRDSIQQEGVRVRALNAIFGGVSVLGAYALGLWATRRRSVGIGTALVTALLPMNAALSGAVSNDPLLFCLCTWVVALLVNEATTSLCIKRGLLIGLLMGLAFLTKTSALLLVPVAIVALISAPKQMPLRRLAPGMVLALAIGGGWWMRNTALYGEPFLQRTFEEVFTGRSPLAQDFIARVGAGNYWNSVLQLTSFSMVGIFGYMDIFLPDMAYHICAALYVLGCAGMLVQWIRNGRPLGPPTWIVGAFMLITFVLFVQFNMKFFQAQARYLLPAIAAFSLLYAGGLRAWFGARTKYGLVATALGLGLLNAFVINILPESFEARTRGDQTQDPSTTSVP